MIQVQLPVEPSFLVNISFVALPLLMACWLLSVIWRTGDRSSRGFLNRKNLIGIILVWILVSAGFAMSGLSRVETMPPLMFPVLLCQVVLLILFVRSGFAKSLASNIGWTELLLMQGFRFPLELVMNQAAQEGLMPSHMSFYGTNYDILSGVLFLVLGGINYMRPLPNWSLWLSNLLGLALLLNVMGLAILSIPSPIQQIVTDPPNVWITFFPFIWLPTILVSLALTLHFLAIRKLRIQGS